MDTTNNGQLERKHTLIYVLNAYFGKILETSNGCSMGNRTSSNDNELVMEKPDANNRFLS
jgi:hypothetical protein